MTAKRIFIDQYDVVHYAHSVKELRANLGGAITRMYRDAHKGRPVHIGYVVGQLWLTEVTIRERPA
jgi:hypothetical protein